MCLKLYVSGKSVLFSTRDTSNFNGNYILKRTNTRGLERLQRLYMTMLLNFNYEKTGGRVISI